MARRDLQTILNHVSDKTQYSPDACLKFYKAFREVLEELLIQHGKVRLPGLATFYVRNRAPFKGGVRKDPITGKEWICPPRPEEKTVAIQPMTRLKAKVKTSAAKVGKLRRGESPV